MSDSMIMDAIASCLVLPNRLVVPLVQGLPVAQLRSPLPRVTPETPTAFLVTAPAHPGCCFTGGGADLPAGGTAPGGQGQLREGGDGRPVRPLRHIEGRPPALHLQTRRQH